MLTDLLSFSREVVLEALALAEEEVIPPEEEALMAMLDYQNNQALCYHLVPKYNEIQVRNIKVISET